jgi:hypothetical protein
MNLARHWWITSVIIANQEDHSLKPAPDKYFRKPISQNHPSNKGELVEWFK